MPKYYVKSGQIYFIINAQDHKDAVILTLKHFNGKGLITHQNICVSEIGFDDNKHITCYDTDDFMRIINAKDN
jgi:hypothetical protein